MTEAGRDLHDRPDRVVIFGAGLAGLSAGIVALEEGSKVTLFEKSPRPGGTTLLSTGFVWTFEDYEELRTKIPAGDPNLQWLVHETLPAGYDFLLRNNVSLGAPVRMLGHGRGRQIQPQQAIEALTARFLALGGTLECNASLHKLVLEDGAAVGIEVERNGRIGRESAGAVILATGGFQGNTELLARYALLDASNVILRSNPYSTGDGFLAAMDAGAQASQGLQAFYGHAIAAEPARFNFSNLGEVSQFHGFISVAVNMKGERFVDEAAGTGEECLNQALARQPGGGFFIVDADGLEREVLKGVGVLAGAVIERAKTYGALVVTAETLDGLCEALAAHGLHQERLAAELSAYNSAIQAGQQPFPSREKNRYPLIRGPFTAIKVKAGITFTMGGIRIDERARVLRRSGSTSPLAPVPVERAYAATESTSMTIGNDYRQTVIPGLYAAGCDAGNISHTNYMGGLAAALTTGMTAGGEAARFKRTLSTH